MLKSRYDVATLLGQIQQSNTCAGQHTASSGWIVLTPRNASRNVLLALQANEILHHKLTLNGYLSEFTGQTIEQMVRSVCSLAR
jgi:hypothetical protein